MIDDKEYKKIWKKYRDEWDKEEKKVMDEIGDVTEQEALDADSYLAKVENKQEKDLDDRTIRALKKGFVLARKDETKKKGEK
jgi:hypothetical protein|tara:strand:- start:164 stop:409 length:246 start_codon:yes stop_codon:yes gene_type:complete